LVGIQKETLERVIGFIQLSGSSASLPPYGTAMIVAAVVVIGLGLGIAVWRGLPPASVVMGFRDFALYGGLLSAGACGWMACRLMRIDAWLMADAFAPALGLGITIMRAGCFLHGCCFGTVTDLSWGVVYPAGSPAHLYQSTADIGVLFRRPDPVHPTQIYELLAGLAAAAIALVLIRRRAPSGAPFLVAAIVFTSFRWFNHGLRVQAGTLDVSPALYPTLYATLIIAGCLMLLWRIRKGRSPSTSVTLQVSDKPA
jgi:phosphatidylglycerol:prolipoprotein diacylglycerol transferase